MCVQWLLDVDWRGMLRPEVALLEIFIPAPIVHIADVHRAYIEPDGKVSVLQRDAGQHDGRGGRGKAVI